MKRTRTRILFTLLAVLILNAESVFAQSAALGSDVSTGFMQEMGMFRPHWNFCNSSTEGFVTVTPDGRGYCIEKAERATATWEAARNNCIADSKRLPEPGEFKVACQLAGSLSLSNMTDNPEWATNFPMVVQYISGSTTAIAAADAGNGSCAHGAFGYISTSNGNEDSLHYRCVR